jgi:hypothetical protein
MATDDTETTTPAKDPDAPAPPLNPDHVTETNDEAAARIAGEEAAIKEQESKNTGSLKALDPEATKAERKSLRDKLLSVFIKLSGYDESDVDVIGERTRTIGTTNGGKYQLTGKGGIRKLKGPNYPKFTEE